MRSRLVVPLLAAAVGGAVILALYVLKLRRRPVRVSNAHLFERAAKDLQANVPFRMLRANLLLLLHLLILALLALALGRPVLEDAPAAAWAGLAAARMPAATNASPLAAVRL